MLLTDTAGAATTSEPGDFGSNPTTRPNEAFLGLPVNFTDQGADDKEQIFGLPVNLTSPSETSTQVSASGSGSSQSSLFTSLKPTELGSAETSTLSTQDLIQKVGEAETDPSELLPANRESSTDQAIRVTTLSGQPIGSSTKDQEASSAFSQNFNLSTLETLGSIGSSSQRPEAPVGSNPGSGVESSTFKFVILEAEEITTMMSRVVGESDSLGGGSTLQPVTESGFQVVSSDQGSRTTLDLGAPGGSEEQATTVKNFAAGPTSETSAASGAQSSQSGPATVSTSGVDLDVSVTTVKTQPIDQAFGSDDSRLAGQTTADSFRDGDQEVSLTTAKTTDIGEDDNDGKAETESAANAEADSGSSDQGQPQEATGTTSATPQAQEPLSETGSDLAGVVTTARITPDAGNQNTQSSDESPTESAVLPVIGSSETGVEPGQDESGAALPQDNTSSSPTLGTNLSEIAPGSEPRTESTNGLLAEQADLTTQRSNTVPESINGQQDTVTEKPVDTASGTRTTELPQSSGNQGQDLESRNKDGLSTLASQDKDEDFATTAQPTQGGSTSGKSDLAAVTSQSGLSNADEASIKQEEEASVTTQSSVLVGGQSEASTSPGLADGSITSSAAPITVLGSSEASGVVDSDTGSVPTTAKPLPINNDAAQPTSRPSSDDAVVLTTTAAIPSRPSDSDDANARTTTITTPSLATAPPIRTASTDRPSSTTTATTTTTPLFQNVPLIIPAKKGQDPSNTFDGSDEKKDGEVTTESHSLFNVTPSGEDETKPEAGQTSASGRPDAGDGQGLDEDGASSSTSSGPAETASGDESSQDQLDNLEGSITQATTSTPGRPTSSSVLTDAPPLRVDDGESFGSESTLDENSEGEVDDQSERVGSFTTGASPISVLGSTETSLATGPGVEPEDVEPTGSNTTDRAQPISVLETFDGSGQDDAADKDSTLDGSGQDDFVTSQTEATRIGAGPTEAATLVITGDEDSSVDQSEPTQKVTSSFDDLSTDQTLSVAEESATQPTLPINVQSLEPSQQGQEATTAATVTSSSSSSSTTTAASQEGFLSPSLFERIRDILLTLAAGLMTQAISFPVVPSRRGDVTESPNRVPQFPIIRDPSIRKKIEEGSLSFSGNVLNLTIPIQPSDLDKLHDEALQRNLTAVATDAFRPVQDVHDVDIIVDENDQQGRIIITAQRDESQDRPEEGDQDEGSFGTPPILIPTLRPVGSSTSGTGPGQPTRPTRLPATPAGSRDSGEEFEGRPRPFNRPQDEGSVLDQSFNTDQTSGTRNPVASQGQGERRPTSSSTEQTPPFGTGRPGSSSRLPGLPSQADGVTQGGSPTSAPATTTGSEIRFEFGDAIPRPSSSESTLLGSGPTTSRPRTTPGSGREPVTASPTGQPRPAQPTRNPASISTPGPGGLGVTPTRGTPVVSVTGQTTTEQSSLSSSSASERTRINNKFNPELNFPQPPTLGTNAINETNEPDSAINPISSAARPLPVLNSDEEFFGAVSSDDDDRFFDSRINVLGGSSANIVQATVVEDLNFARSVRDSSIGIATISSITVGVIALLGFGLLIFLALARRRRMRRHGSSSMGSPMVTPTQSRTTFSGSPIMGGDNTPSLSDTRAASFLDDQLNTSSSAGSSLDPVLPLDGHGTIVTSYDDYMSLPENLRGNIWSSLAGSGSGIGSATGPSPPPPPVPATDSIPRTRNLPESSDFLFSRSPPPFNPYPV